MHTKDLDGDHSSVKKGDVVKVKVRKGNKTALYGATVVGSGALSLACVWYVSVCERVCVHSRRET